jgi:CheY-like chemotaxis protein
VPPPSASDATSDVVRLHPIRTLVLGDDLAYRERALAVIGELGPVSFASLAGCDDLADVLALVAHERPDVVVLDASAGEEAAVRVIGGLAGAAAPVGVVVVCEQSTAAARRLGARPKWGWTQDLRSAVEGAYAHGHPRLPELLPTSDAPRPAGPLAGWVEDSPAPDSA